MHPANKSFLTANILYAITPVLLMLVGLPFSSILIGAGSFNSTYALVTIIAEVLAVAVLPVVLLFLPAGREMREQFMRLVRGFDMRLLLIVPIGLIGYFFVNGLTAVWVGSLTSIGLDPEAMGDLIPSPQNTNEYILSLLAIGVSPALCEELFFRGMLMPAIRRKFYSPWIAIVLSGCLFAIMHGSTAALPGHLALGIVIGYVVYVSGSIWAGVILHFIQNSLAMTMLYFQDSIASFLPDAESASEAIAGADNPIVGLMEQLHGPTLMAGGWFYIILFGGMLFLLLLALYATYKKKLGKDPLSQDPDWAVAKQAVLQPMLDQSKPDRLIRFIPWIPLAVVAPLILFNYGLSLLVMLPFFTNLL